MLSPPMRRPCLPRGSLTYVTLFSWPRPNERKFCRRTGITAIGTQVARYASRDGPGYYHLQYKYEVDGKTYRRFIYVGSDNTNTRPFCYAKPPRKRRS